MQPPADTTDLLALHAMPQLAAILRSRVQRITKRWTESVEKHLPDADPLTSKEVRDSIPTVLEKIANALESGRPQDTYVLAEVGEAHGVARFQQHYNIEELIIEYRILRRVVFDEMRAASGDKLTFMDGVPVDMAIDIALQRGVTNFVQHLTEQLRSAAATESKYLTFLSHDLRNNLNTVTLMLQMLARQLEGSPGLAEAARDLESLRAAVFETIGGMDRLLQAERLRKHAVTLKLGPVDLHRLAEDMLAQVSQKAAAKGLQLENAVPPDAGAHSDRELLALVLQNLVGNAVKFSSSGTVRIGAQKDALGWRVAVSDQGPGIAPEHLAELFKAFSRGETHGQPGVGLGLNIASHAARLLGSELAVESQLGKGTTFTFQLPAARPEISH